MIWLNENYDSGRHRGVVEQALSHADDALHHVSFHQSFAHRSLVASEEDTMWEEDRRTTGLAVKALGDVLEA